MCFSNQRETLVELNFMNNNALTQSYGYFFYAMIS